jgi:hypothetical protein
MKHQLNHAELQKKLEETQRKKKEQREKRMLELVKFKMAETWTKEEEESAIKKVTDIAFSYDPNQMGGLGVRHVASM